MFNCWDGGWGALSIVLLGALYMAVVHVHMECQGGDYLYYLHMGFYGIYV